MATILVMAASGKGNGEDGKDAGKRRDKEGVESVVDKEGRRGGNGGYLAALSMVPASW